MGKLSVLSLMKEKLVGKTLKIKKITSINQDYSVWVKKSNNVTNTQFDSGNLKFRKLITRTKRIGTHTIFNYFIIEDIYVSYSNGYDGYNGLRLKLSGDNETTLEVDDELTQIDNDTYLIQ
jgi:hypothetical protein